MNDYRTTGTFWGNACGRGENFMPEPIQPDRFRTWALVDVNVVRVDSFEKDGRDHISLYITWTWLGQ